MFIGSVDLKLEFRIFKTLYKFSKKLNSVNSQDYNFIITLIVNKDIELNTLVLNL